MHGLEAVIQQKAWKNLTRTIDINLIRWKNLMFEWEWNLYFERKKPSVLQVPYFTTLLSLPVSYCVSKAYDFLSKNGLKTQKFFENDTSSLVNWF